MGSGLEFEWDDDKAAANLAKHGVTFEYATRVFLDPAAVDFDASHPEDGETRRKRVGVIDGLLFVAVYTERKEVIRMISARRANTMERKLYGTV